MANRSVQTQIDISWADSISAPYMRASAIGAPGASATRTARPHWRSRCPIKRRSAIVFEVAVWGIGGPLIVRRETMRPLLLLRGICVVVTLGVLAACAGRAPPAPSTLPPEPTAAVCHAKLSAQGASFTSLGRPAARRGSCGVADPVALAGLTAEYDRPVTIACPLAAALNEFEAQVLQPAARRYFGQGVARVSVISAYSCRRIAGQAGRLSQHAFGRAIDISGYELDDGTMIDVRRHWRGAGDRSRFLRQVARGACRHFNVVLTPNHDAAHATHLHFDLGPWPLCGV